MSTVKRTFNRRISTGVALLAVFALGINDGAQAKRQRNQTQAVATSTLIETKINADDSLRVANHRRHDSRVKQVLDDPQDTGMNIHSF